LEKTLVPTYHNGSNSNRDSDGKRAVAFMAIEATEAQQAWDQVIFLENFLDERRRKVPLEWELVESTGT